MKKAHFTDSQILAILKQAEDWLSHYIYSDISELQDKATDWLWTYNNERPNMGIGGITPIQKLEKLNNGNSTDSLH